MALFCKEDIQGKDTLYCFFSGHGTFDKEGMKYEWEKTAKDIEADKIFFCNKPRAWYQDVIREVYKKIEKFGEGKKIVTIGASMGGYASLLFGHLFNGKSITFSPQTILKPNDFDMRWKKSLQVISQFTGYKEYLDLSFIEGMQHHIYYGVNCKEDVFQAERLCNVSLHPIDYPDHDIAKYLKGQGRLKEIVLEMA